MNLYKIALSLLVCAAPAAARLSSDEKDSSAVMRELMSMKSEFASLKADNEALKNEVASLKKNRGLMPDVSDLEGVTMPEIPNIEELADKLGVGVDPSVVGGGPLYDILDGIISTLLGVTNCVGFDFDFDRRRLSSKRRLPPSPTCIFGNPDTNVFIGGNEIELNAFEIDLDADFIGDWSIFRETFAVDLIVDIGTHSLASATNTTEARKEKKA